MNVRSALKEQYHAGLAMLDQCVGLCSNEQWTAPNPPTPVERASSSAWGGLERTFWRIAFHAAFYTHLYLGQNEEAFQAPPATAAVRREEFEEMWRPPWQLEPYEFPIGVLPCKQLDVQEYIAFVDALVDATVDGLDLDSKQSGFRWFKSHSKLSHELMNLRHLQGHVGQLSELLMLRGIDSEYNWSALPTAPS